MTIDECIEAYTTLADRVFVKKHQRLSLKGKIQGQYDSENLKSVIQEIIVKAGYGQDDLFWDQHPNACKV